MSRLTSDDDNKEISGGIEPVRDCLARFILVTCHSSALADESMPHDTVGQVHSSSDVNAGISPSNAAYNVTKA